MQNIVKESINITKQFYGYVCITEQIIMIMSMRYIQRIRFAEALDLIENTFLSIWALKYVKS